MSPCFTETLRKHPVAPLLTRKCTKNYKIPGSNVTLEKGTFIIIPVISLHHDKKFYDQPEKFDPNRFFSSSNSGSNHLHESKTSHRSLSPYLPFGDGQRACLGRRFAKMLIKVGITAVLQKCCIELDSQQIEHEFQCMTPFGAFLRPQTGVQLRFKARKVLVSSHRTDFLDMIDQFSPGELEFSRDVCAPMRSIPKIQRHNVAAYRKRMSLL